MWGVIRQSDRPESMFEGGVLLILRRKCFDFSLHFKLKISRLDQADGLTFDHNLRLTSFLD
jgi:hypothetical protein